MAQRKGVAARTKEKTPAEIAAEALAEAVAAGGGNEGESDLEAELREFSGAKVRVSKATGAQGSPGGYMFSVNTDEISMDDLLDRIRDEYGGGEYRLRVFSNGRFVMNRNISVAESTKKPVSQVQPVQPAQSQDRFAELIIAMQENSRAMMDAVREQQLVAAQGMQEMMVRIFEANSHGSASAASSPTDLLAIVGLVKDLFKKSGGESEINLFLEGVKFARGDSGGDGNPVADILKTLGAPLMSMVTAAQKAQTAPALPRPPTPQQLTKAFSPAPAAQGEMTAPAAPIVETAESPVAQMQNADWQVAQAQLLPYINILVTAANLDADPGTYADMILDFVPADQAKLVLESDEHYFRCLSMAPDINDNNRAWFDALRATLLRFIAEDETEGAAGVPESAGQGDFSNPAGSEDTD